MQIWYPKAVRNPAVRDGGSMVDGYGWKAVEHTTESDSPFRPSRHQYGSFGHTYYPHFTTDPDGTVYQHIPINRAGRALKGSRRTQTNRGRAIQNENVGRSSADPATILTTAQVEANRRRIAWLQQQVPLAAVALPAGRIPNSATASAPQRLSPAEWRAFSGVCGHRHVPDNDHWDPGAFDLSRLLTEPKEWDEMATRDEIKQAMREVLAEDTYVTSDGERQLLVRESAGLAVHIRTGDQLRALADTFPVRNMGWTRADVDSRFEVV